jgi:hypothetical protein
VRTWNLDEVLRAVSSAGSVWTYIASQDLALLGVPFESVCARSR